MVICIPPRITVIWLVIAAVAHGGRWPPAWSADAAQAGRQAASAWPVVTPALGVRG